jgi:hypothetical protein
MTPDPTDAKERRVNVKPGDVVLVHVSSRLELRMRRFASGAFEIRDAHTNQIVRQWAPKDASARRPSTRKKGET